MIQTTLLNDSFKSSTNNIAVLSSMVCCCIKEAIWPSPRVHILSFPAEEPFPTVAHAVWHVIKRILTNWWNKSIWSYASLYSHSCAARAVSSAWKSLCFKERLRGLLGWLQFCGWGIFLPWLCACVCVCVSACAKVSGLIHYHATEPEPLRLPLLVFLTPVCSPPV